MASRTSVWRSVSWSKKTKSQNKDLPKLDTSLANTNKDSTIDPLTPPSYSQAISPGTVVDTNRRVGNRSPITPPESPPGGISVHHELGFGYGEGSGSDGRNGSSGSSQEIEKPFQRSVARDIKWMVEGPDEQSPISDEWEEEVCEVSEQSDGEVEEKSGVQGQTQIQVQVVSKDVQGKSGEKKERRIGGLEDG
ncbi:21fc5d45-7f98-42ca-8542-6361b41ac6b6-CDS [Sclerotinia trifoliorum]|uniref:21fc5d45-7f98-42ca-8542-6361b41ac6b6-CDS n=1 Tax=Sclerotinia trifoliorum TaxID=28548 RepID=A0A8H2ZPM8_9HELO|nr:21fc5d45-7f98-42ca-8542-6361b41ac6b6-CDS [Sclerotinia trifoliorum]